MQLEKARDAFLICNFPAAVQAHSPGEYALPEVQGNRTVGVFLNEAWIGESGTAAEALSDEVA